MYLFVNFPAYYHPYTFKYNLIPIIAPIPAPTIVPIPGKIIDPIPAPNIVILAPIAAEDKVLTQASFKLHSNCFSASSFISLLSLFILAYYQKATAIYSAKPPRTITIFPVLNILYPKNRAPFAKFWVI